MRITKPKRRTAIILAGHGSHISPQTAGLVWEQVDRLRVLNASDEITAAFWKEVPSFHTVLDTLTADDITIVPLFTARGYFTQTVIPAEMGLTGAITERDGRTIRYTEPLGAHPRIGVIVRERVLEAIRTWNADPNEVAVAVIGHSTRRNPESRLATEAQANALRDAGIAAQVVAVYLDDSPEIPELYRMTDAPFVIAVPYFLALGSHVTIDVPAELGFASGATNGVIDGRTVIYVPPVGVADGLTDMILDLGGEPHPPSASPCGEGWRWSNFPVAGRDMLMNAVNCAGSIRFGQLRLTCDCVQVEGDEAPDELIDNPTDLRKKIRENPFRPLATSTDLPRGWRVEVDSLETLHAVVETIYPGVIADWAARPLRVRPLDATIARQTGNYRKLKSLTAEKRAELVEKVCGACVRHPTWHDGIHGAIPCPDACNLWLSAALSAALNEVEV